MKKKIVAILVTLTITTTFLVGCSETPFSPPLEELPPPGNGVPTTFGLVEVTISGIGTESMMAYARPASRNVAFDLTAPSNNAALSLDGSGDYVTVNDVSDNLAAASAFTIEAWVYPDAATGGQQALLGFHTAGGDNLNILFYNPDTDQFTYYDPTNSYIFASGTYTPGQWYHIALVIDGSSSNNGTLYINGQSKATFTTADRPITGGLFSIGQEYDAGPVASDFFKGRIDEVRIWNTARTQAEIQNNMNSQISPSTVGFVSYYRFNEGTGTTTVDLSGDNDGVFQFDAAWGIGPQLGASSFEGTIQLRPISNGSFTYGARGSGGLRYLYATFEVRNAEADGTPYAFPLQNLTFLAVDTDASVGTPETYEITAISELRLFDGTLLKGAAAGNIAETTIPTGWVGYNGSIISVNPDVLQVFSEADVGALAPVSPGVAVFPYGFITRSPAVTPGSRTLPALAGDPRPVDEQFDGVVTFAFKLPLQTQANLDPFEIKALFLPVDDSQTRITQSLEEQTSDGQAALAVRVAELSPDFVTIFPGSHYSSSITQLQCGSIRIAGPKSTPVATLFPAQNRLVSLAPDPYANDGSASHISATIDFTATFAEPVSEVNAGNFIVRGFHGGQRFVGQTYMLSSTTASSPAGNFFPNELVEVTITGSLACQSHVVRYRVETTAGNGSFVEANDSPFPAGDRPAAVAIGDMNDDSTLDIVIVNSSSNEVTVLLGNGVGGFDEAAAAGSPFSVGTRPEAVALGDVDGNGVLDIITANVLADNVTVLLGDGTGGFNEASGSPHPVSTGPEDLALGDVDGNGTLDIVTASPGSDAVTVLLGDGAGGFNEAAVAGSPFSVGDFPKAMALGELNGDGNLDMAVTNGIDHTVTVLLGDGAGGFDKASGSPHPVSTRPVGLVLGDVDGDGILDIVTANVLADNVTVLLGNGTGGFNVAPGSPHPVSAGPEDLALGDVNADGLLDIVTADDKDTAGDAVSVLLGTGSGGFAPSSPFGIGSGINPKAIAIGDLNGDGALDIVTANRFTQDVSVLLNQ